MFGTVSIAIAEMQFEKKRIAVQIYDLCSTISQYISYSTNRIFLIGSCYVNLKYLSPENTALHLLKNTNILK
jgi:hypothetical protein